MRLSAEYGPWPMRNDFLTYMKKYIEVLNPDIRFGTDAQRVDRDGDRWVVRTSDGDLRTEHVIVATGLHRKPFVPDWPGLKEFEGEFLHAREYTVPDPYVGKDVLVVGCGPTGIDIAVAAAQAGRVPGADVHPEHAGPVQAEPQHLPALPGHQARTAAALARQPGQPADAPDAVGGPVPLRDTHAQGGHDGGHRPHRPLVRRDRPRPDRGRPRRVHRDRPGRHRFQPQGGAARRRHQHQARRGHRGHRSAPRHGRAAGAPGRAVPARRPAPWCTAPRPSPTRPISISRATGCPPASCPTWPSTRGPSRAPSPDPGASPWPAPCGAGDEQPPHPLGDEPGGDASAAARTAALRRRRRRSGPDGTVHRAGTPGR